MTSTYPGERYYLPLHAVVRALAWLRDPPRPTPPPRGTLRVVWRHLTCDEMRRFAVAATTEAELRAHHATCRDPSCAVGLLVVEQVVRGGAGEAAGLETGDLLVDCGGVAFPEFDDLEAFLDAQTTRGKFEIAVERGGTRVALDVGAAEDLHALNPRAFLEFGGGVLHALSLGAARNGNLELASGVYVAFAGFVLDAAGVPAHSVVVALNDVPTPTLAAFEAAARAVKDGERVAISASK